MPPIPDPKERPGYAGLLQDSPLLSSSKAEELFPSRAEQDELENLASKLDDAIQKNKTDAQTWGDLEAVKSVVITLAKAALGRV